MSREAVQGFLHKIDTDQEFAKLATMCSCVSELAQVARSVGFEFEPDEFIEITKASEKNDVDLLMEMMDLYFAEPLSGENA